MKKIYNQPQMEICEMQIESLMISVSTNSGGGGGGDAHAPARHGDFIPVY